MLNTDGAVKMASGLASAGGLIRDSASGWVTGFVLNIGVTNSLMAELWGVREGLLLARSLGLHDVVVELDALIIVQFLKSSVDLSHPCSALLEDVAALVREGWVREVRHIFREGNQCADFLANMAQSYPVGLSVLCTPPPGLLPLLEADARGRTYIRT